jgi:hypothetical protein
MGRRPKKPIGWLCAAALVAAAATAATVNSSEAALFGKRTTGVVSSCTQHKGTRCDVSIPERPERSFRVSAPQSTHRDAEIAVRYRDDSVVRDTFGERLVPLALLTIGLCIVGACLAASVARLRSRQSFAARALFIAVPIIFFSLILTTCAAGLTEL